MVRLFAQLARQPTHPTTQPSPASQEGLDATTLDSGLPPDPEPPWPPLPDTSSTSGATPAPANGSRATTPSTRASVKSSSTPTGPPPGASWNPRSEEQTSELQSLMRISYAVF